MLAKELLHGMDRRWSHVVKVATEAEKLASTIFDDKSEGEVLVMAAWLHDIGYAAPLAKTGFHHLDGANYLEDRGEHRLACLVAHHSSGAQEGHLRGFDQEMSRFPAEPGRLAPLFHFRLGEREGLFKTYLDSFEKVFTNCKPVRVTFG